MLKKIRDLKLKAKFGVAVGLIGFVALFGIGAFVMGAFNQYSRTGVLVDANRVSDHILIVAGKQAIERGATAAVMANPNDNESYTKIASLRQTGDKYLDSGLAVARTLAAKGSFVQQRIEILTKARQQRDDVRRQVDGVLTRTVADPRLSADWVKAQTALIMQENELAKALFRARNNVEQILEFNNIIKNSVFLASEFAGRERANLGMAIASGKPIDAERYKNLMQFRGVVEQNLQSVLGLKGSASISEATKNAMEEMERVFLKEFEEVRRSVYDASAQQQPYPLTGGEWIGKSTRAINAILKVSEAVSRDAEKLAQQQSADSVRSIVFSIAFLVVLVIAIAVSVWIVRLVTRPVQELAHQSERLAEGDLSVVEAPEIEAILDVKDEIGDLARSFQKMVSNLRETVHQLIDASSAVASASSEISSSTEEMAAGAQEQTSQAGEVASAVEKMTKTIVENSKNASDTAGTAKEAKIAAEQGGRVVEETVEGMKQIAEVVRKSAGTVQELGKSSDQIGEIISVIDDIADQTNLLALNAAIEAARAGEQGRGFAVVADEVRKLAERTTKATKEIAGMIKKIQTDTKGAVESMEEGTMKVDAGIHLADKAGVSLQEIVEISQKVTDMVTQIAAASEQQSSASEQISKNVEGISAVTGETAQGTQQIARAADDLNRLTENLQQLVGKFKLSGSGEGGQQIATKPHVVRKEKSKVAVRDNGVLVSHE